MSRWKEKLIEAASSDYKMSDKNARMYFRMAANQTLQELKEKVEDLYQNDECIDVCRGYDIALDDVIHLIGKRIDQCHE